MKITFTKDHQSVASGNSLYKKGTPADLSKGQRLIDLGVARAGWDAPIAEAEEMVFEDLSGYTVAELREMCQERRIPYSGLLKAQLIEALHNG